jgi:cephalosporin hydroxylase
MGDVIESKVPIEMRLDQSLRDYWMERVGQHIKDSYAGIPMSKFPEDLRTYEHLIWQTDANAVVEIGTQFGGSALWFRDRLVAFAKYRPWLPAPLVITLDLDNASTRATLSQIDPEYAKTIRVLDGDVREEAVQEALRSNVPEGARCLVIEDSAHVYDTTYAALKAFSGLVPVGGYFVVEDGCVDVAEMRLDETWPRGVLPALRDWLATPEASSFVMRREAERYGVTCHPSGFLERVK